MKINSENLDLFCKDFKDCVKALEEKYEIELSLGTISYDAEEFTCKMTARNPDVDYDLKNWCQNCWKQEFEPKDYGRLFQYEGETYKIIGINNRKRNTPIILERISDHKPFYSSTLFVKSALEESDIKQEKEGNGKC